ncbi:cyclopropane fatty-acyl-phospholipid synthase-like methyltransferase [Saccharothrix tamanrassetensis]|uniref:Cyclopropane fatty-acyl-phospholipid synthase-like methyltransferase n=1 Tax=Saccharothrix tamanrassetensis TaxID=1051531 RepID=A0A841CPJ7_9PSEU|nr:class I SAM-dependent methyltransferase [Saccharothrix tamanrassetensis]MBB5957426.1 cyclopropane fatty-acyl-phospholipid synthase-like methyltransferase [Saccharothrix tamanrassetensis]
MTSQPPEHGRRRAPIADSYNDANALFRFLSHLGWGDLVNIGYFTWPALPAVLGGLGWFQRRLLHRSLALLDARPGHRVLDACCGRGLSTATLGEAGCAALGLDVQDEQIAEARRRFGDRPNTRFAVADVTALPPRAADVELADGTFDRVHCLEAAFHFGPDGRRAFLAESFRLLRPGGRLVLVDLTWPTADPGTIDTADPTGLVRSAWCFEDLEPLPRYLTHAAEVGFTVRAVHDWTRPVVRLPLGLMKPAPRLVATEAGRRALCLRWPGLRELTRDDWAEVVTSVRAHLVFGRACRYSALVLDRPGPAGSGGVR